ncbi:hypothetical protein J2X24_002994 [Asticcacaulis solisilvae]|nr:hypothetical protein [Asticcacaulis solisilvae]MDR6801461.1 hypothetical protein [Asticcacaulis sp. BE141]
MISNSTDPWMIDPQAPEPSTPESLIKRQDAFTPVTERAARHPSVSLTPEEERICDMATD